MDNELILIVFGALMANVGQLIAAWWICREPTAKHVAGCLPESYFHALNAVINGCWDEANAIERRI